MGRNSYQLIHFLSGTGEELCHETKLVGRLSTLDLVSARLCVQQEDLGQNDQYPNTPWVLRFLISHLLH